jgi:ubiquinone biosynthesis protein Coq4
MSSENKFISNMNISEHIITFSIEKAVPVLNLFRKKSSWKHPLTSIRNFPDQTLGKELALFLDQRKMQLLPQYEVHDVLHVVLNYDTSPTEEFLLQGFMIGNGSSSFGGKVLAYLGMMIIPERIPAFRTAFRRGRQAKSIQLFELENCLEFKLTDLRINLNLPEREAC